MDLSGIWEFAVKHKWWVLGGGAVFGGILLYAYLHKGSSTGSSTTGSDLLVANPGSGPIPTSSGTGGGGGNGVTPAGPALPYTAPATGNTIGPDLEQPVPNTIPAPASVVTPTTTSTPSPGPGTIPATVSSAQTIYPASFASAPSGSAAQILYSPTANPAATTAYINAQQTMPSTVTGGNTPIAASVPGITVSAKTPETVTTPSYTGTPLGPGTPVISSPATVSTPSTTQLLAGPGSLVVSTPTDYNVGPGYVPIPQSTPTQSQLATQIQQQVAAAPPAKTTPASKTVTVSSATGAKTTVATSTSPSGGVTLQLPGSVR